MRQHEQTTAHVGGLHEGGGGVHYQKLQSTRAARAAASQPVNAIDYHYGLKVTIGSMDAPLCVWIRWENRPKGPVSSAHRQFRFISVFFRVCERAVGVEAPWSEGVVWQI